MYVQVVCITDPVLATHVLRSKHVDKLRFQYSFLDPVSPVPVIKSCAFPSQQHHTLLGIHWFPCLANILSRMHV